MEDLYFDSTSDSIEETAIKYDEDTLSPIANPDIPEFLLLLDLESLYNLSLINKRIYNIIRNNTFWYLKMEKDYSIFVYPWLERSHKCYIGKIVHQHIVDNSKDYYMFCIKYHKYLNEHVVNDSILFKQLLKLICNNAIQLNHLLMLLSLTYHDINLDRRMKSKKMELLSKNTLISTLFTKDDNNAFIEDGVCVDLYGVIYSLDLLDTCSVTNLYSIIKMYEYLTKPIMIT